MIEDKLEKYQRYLEGLERDLKDLTAMYRNYPPELAKDLISGIIELQSWIKYSMRQWVYYGA